MMRSLFAGVSGLRNHQTRMDVIGNNIANVNTVGFKAGRVNFQDVLSQTLQGAAGASGNRGGTNPMQVGLGMGLASIDTIFTDGSFQPTGKQTDLSIKGQGFFVLSDGANQVFTRAGSFDFDNLGNFLVPGTGYKVMGWMANNGVIDTNTTVSAIKVPVGASMPAKVTEGITYANNLSAEAAADATSKVPTSITIYDQQGNPYKLNGSIQKTDAANREWTFTFDSQIKDGNGNVIADVNDGQTTPAAAGYKITFNEDGTFKQVDPLVTGGTLKIIPKGANAGAAAFSINLYDPTTPTVPGLNFTSLTQYGGNTTIQAVGQTGYASGTLESTTIDPNGVIVGRFSNGQSQNMAQVALATFNNASGLTKIGDSLFAKSNNSGEAQIGTTGTGGRGTFNPGTLEMANVDLAQEFSNMIITQRGFQANSKIISVTDEMLQDLANLKR